MQVLQWLHKQSTRRVAILSLLVSIVIPWGIGVTTLPGFDATFYQARWWVGQINYAPGGSLDVTLLPELVWLHVHESSFFAVIAWQVSTALLAIATILGAVDELLNWNALSNLPTGPVMAWLFGVAGLGYVIAAIGFTFFGLPGVTVPVSGVLLIGAAVLVLRTQH